jgi:SCP-2 sterol transfer family
LQGLVVFHIDGEQWTLDLRPDSEKKSVRKGGPAEGAKPDLELTISDANFVAMVMGKLGPQKVGIALKFLCIQNYLCITVCMPAEPELPPDLLTLLARMHDRPS